MIKIITFLVYYSSIPVKMVALAVCLSVLGSARAADNALAAPLCNVLKEVVPKVSTYKPEGAQAQLVMAVAQVFDYDGQKLQRVNQQIDEVTTASCPENRESLLAILKMKSLREAIQ